MRRFILILALPLVAAASADPRADIVHAAGADRFGSVDEVRFTFNVEMPGRQVHRAWDWHPKTGAVELRDGDKTVSYVRTTDSATWSPEARDADKAFINDSFWLVPAVHLSWAGPDVKIEDHGTAPLPVGSGTARKVTVTYPKTGGGYTPGDAYDLYLDDAAHIVAWSYRRGGADAPTMSTTFADRHAFGPLDIALDHRSADGKFRLYFTDVAVTP